MNKENKKRVARAHKALADHYEKNCPKNTDWRRTAVVDLLTNLQHYCHQYDIDFSRAAAMAEDHYTAESGNQYRILLSWRDSIGSGVSVRYTTASSKLEAFGLVAKEYRRAHKERSFTLQECRLLS